MSQSYSRLGGQYDAPASSVGVSAEEPGEPSQVDLKVLVRPEGTADTHGRLKSTAGQVPQGWKGARGRKRYLKRLVDMPYDILLEIFGHLSLSMLHTLALSSKALRALLLNRSLSLALWSDAFARLSSAPPPCPEEMSLPQYASFLYSRRCFQCDAKTPHPSRSWLCLSVLCKQCRTTQFMDPKKGELAVGLARDITPTELTKRSSGTGRMKPTPWYFHPAYRKHEGALQSLANRANNQLIYIEKEKAKLEFRLKHHDDFKGWIYAQDRAKSANQKARRAAREIAIIEKLRESGYGDVVRRLKEYYEANDTPTERSNDQLPLLKEFMSVKPLTNKGWEKMKPKVVELFDKIKTRYAESDRKRLILKRTSQLKEAYDRYLETNPDHIPYAPPVQRLAALEPFRAAIYDAQEDQGETLLAVINNLDNYGPTIAAWRAHADEVLLKLVSAAYVGKNKVPLVLADLYSPRVGFKCTRCRSNTITYPEALTHPCIYAAEPFRHSRTDPNAGWDFNEGYWQLELDWRVYLQVGPIVDAYGVDFESATCRWLDEADANGEHILECTRCKTSWRHDNWRKALSHEITRHGPYDIEWPADIKWKRHPTSKLPELEAQTRYNITTEADYAAL